MHMLTCKIYGIQVCMFDFVISMYFFVVYNVIFIALLFTLFVALHFPPFSRPMEFFLVISHCMFIRISTSISIM